MRITIESGIGTGKTHILNIIKKKLEEEGYLTSGIYGDEIDFEYIYADLPTSPNLYKWRD